MEFLGKSDFLDQASRHGKYLPDYSMSDAGIFWNVFHDRSTKQCWPCVTRVMAVSGVSSGKANHNVIVAYFVDPEDGEGKFAGWCGDKYLEDALDIEEVRKRVVKASEAAANCFPSHNAVRLKDLLIEGNGACTEESGGCNFWSVRTRGGCKHFKMALTAVNDDSLEELIQAYDEVMRPGSDEAQEEVQGQSDVVARSAFMHPVLLFGPKGTGKSHVARGYGELPGIGYIEYGCHAGSEGFDLLGQTVPYEGKWIWRDGPMSEAFRRGARGEKIVLCLDELLRMEVSHRSALLSAFGEHRGFYVLRTGRIVSEEDGVGKEETIRCPVANLFLIGTTNVGDQYGVDEIDEALRSRFQLVYMPESAETCDKVVDAELAGKPTWSESAREAVKRALLDAMKKSQTGAKSGSLRSSLDVRALKRVLASSKKPAEVRRGLESESMQCVGLGSDGVPVPEHEVFYRKMVEKVFAGVSIG